MDKHHILGEIKRTAEANRGVPLGRERFYQETGIRVSDWEGKFWARWSDALREAGFEPNRMQTAYNEALLVEKYITLVRELHHFPTVNELRLRAYREPGFPNAKTFLKWGSKQQIVARICRYCKERNGYEDVSALCAAVLDVAPTQSDGRAGPREENFGFVYLVKSGRYHKIGSTNAVGRREYELAIQLPEKATLIHSIRTDDPTGIEQYWHGRFASKHKNGEWFELSGEDVKAFKRRKFM